jgi:hypothetical protein
LLLSLLYGTPAAATAPSATAIAPKPSRLHRIPNSARHFLAGSISAAGGVTLLAPVEIIRLNRMAGGVGGMRALEGGSWWRGNGFEVLAAAPRVGITMATFSLYKRALLLGAFRGADELPRAAVFVAGACAGATATLFTHPLDVVRTKIAIEGASGLASCMQAVRAGKPRPSAPCWPSPPPSYTLIAAGPFTRRSHHILRWAGRHSHRHSPLAASYLSSLTLPSPLAVPHSPPPWVFDPLPSPTTIPHRRLHHALPRIRRHLNRHSPSPCLLSSLPNAALPPGAPAFSPPPPRCLTPRLPTPNTPQQAAPSCSTEDWASP